MASFMGKRGFTLNIKDGAALTFTTTDVGDFKWDGLMGEGHEITPVYERDAYAGAVAGQDAQISGSFSLNLRVETFTHASNNRILDVIHKTGAWASATTTDTMTEEWLVTLEYGDGTEALIFAKCRLTGGFDESSPPSKVSVSFVCYGGVTKS